MIDKIELSHIRQIAITVTDVPASLDFYRDVLGLQFLFSPSENLAFFAAGNIRIMLTTGEGGAKPGSNSLLYFHVSDIESAHAALLARGAEDGRGPQLTAKMPDHELWTAFVRDLDGNLVGLMEERKD